MASNGLTKAVLSQKDPPGGKDIKFLFKRENPTSGAILGRSSRLVGDGDSLHSIAFQEYGDPTLWRALALFNEVDDPLRVPPGTSLLIPAPGEAQEIVKGEAE